MSRYLSQKYNSLEAYALGEQPKDMKYIKLNTNESPYQPSENVLKAVYGETKNLMLYPDPEYFALRKVIAELYSVDAENIIVTNGSDEAINFAFIAFCDKDNTVVFPEITYGFYEVFANLNLVSYKKIPLGEDFGINYEDYLHINKNIIIANPNAPTGIVLELHKIEKIVKTNPNNIIIVDEAYIDFGGESAIDLTKKYDNLLVIQTFSKSRSMAGARLGFAIGNSNIISDLNKIRYSTNPYNVNRMTVAAGITTIGENNYYMNNVKKIIETREYVKKELRKRSFILTDSRANFVFAKLDKISGEDFYFKLRENGILVRHFSHCLIQDYVRISMGTQLQMEVFLQVVDKILNQVAQ